MSKQTKKRSVDDDDNNSVVFNSVVETQTRQPITGPDGKVYHSCQFCNRIFPLEESRDSHMNSCSKKDYILTVGGENQLREQDQTPKAKKQKKEKENSTPPQDHAEDKKINKGRTNVWKKNEEKLSESAENNVTSATKDEKTEEKSESITVPKMKLWTKVSNSEENGTISDSEKDVSKSITPSICGEKNCSNEKSVTRTRMKLWDKSKKNQSETDNIDKDNLSNSKVDLNENNNCEDETGKNRNEKKPKTRMKLWHNNDKNKEKEVVQEENCSEDKIEEESKEDHEENKDKFVRRNRMKLWTEDIKNKSKNKDKHYVTITSENGTKNPVTKSRKSLLRNVKSKSADTIDINDNTLSETKEKTIKVKRIEDILDPNSELRPDVKKFLQTINDDWQEEGESEFPEDAPNVAPVEQEAEPKKRSKPEFDPLMCRYCKIQFENPFDKLKHTREVHRSVKKIVPYDEVAQYFDNEDKNYCPICDKTIKARNYRSIFVKHLMTHTNGTIYTCSVCQQRFRRKDHMRNHEIRHEIR